MTISIPKRILSRNSLAKRSLAKRSLALALTLTLLCPPVGGLIGAAQAQEVPPAAPVAPAPPSEPAPGATVRIPMAPVEAGPINTILLFPFANAIPAAGTTGGFNPDLVGARVEDAIKMRLNVIGRYKANSFSPTLPQIQRALEESGVEGMTENDITPPYNDAQKGQKITAQVGTDGYLLGSVEAINADPTSRNVALTVSASLYSSATGGVVKSLAVTGHGISYNATDQPDALLQIAINDAAGRIVSALNAMSDKKPMVLPPVDYARGHHNNNGSILLGILLAVGVGIAISSSHHSSSNSSSPSTGTTPSGPPAPPTTSTNSGPPAPPNP